MSFQPLGSLGSLGSLGAGSGPSRYTKTGSWNPLPFIHSGFAIYPYQPSLSPLNSPVSPDYPARLSYEAGPGEREGMKGNPYQVPLEVGDEFFAFEEYVSTPEEDGRGDTWYRGYVVQAVSLSVISPPSVGRQSGSTEYPKPEPSVLIGIFPAACVHVRPDAGVDDGTLAAAYEKAIRKAEETAGAHPLHGFGDQMEAVREEDEEVEGLGLGAVHTNGHIEDEGADVVDIHSPGNELSPKRQSLNASKRVKRPKSLVFDRPTSAVEIAAEDAKDQPPLPRLTAGDSTIAGQQNPLVDEIACAIREWYGRLPTYLANREYRLFNMVTQHIDALLLGRRQLLSQTLSGGELVRVRRECVSRLVKCNVAQGLDVIVRSLEDGSVMVVEKDRTYTGASLISGTTCYELQVQLAYIDLIPIDNLFGKASTLTAPAAPPQVTASGHKRSHSLMEITSSHAEPIHRALYHLLLDVHAFNASPCLPGETAELHFSLFNQAESRFITEEYCLVLNHLGSPARDPEQRLGRLRTLFVDLKSEDLGSSVYLVCRIVRNGAMKMRSDGHHVTLDGLQRSGTIRNQSGQLLSEMGTVRRGSSIAETASDDSFSITSGFGGQRITTIDTLQTAHSGSVIDGRPTFRRPLGCAVIGVPLLSKLLVDGEKPGSGVEVAMPIYLPKDEATFATLHEDIINNRQKEFFVSSRTEAISISLKLFQGSSQKVIREHPSLLLDVPTTARLGFPDVPSLREHRNELYVKLWSADFQLAPTSNGGSIRVRKSVSPSNYGLVQITLEVRNQDGTLVHEALTAGGSGEPPVSAYHSLVFANSENPVFGELVKVSLPIRAEGCHLYVTLRSRSKDRSTNNDPQALEKPFAFGYLPLVHDAACIKDGSHNLVLYRMEKNMQPTPHVYFEAPSVQSTIPPVVPEILRGLTPLRDRVAIRTYLCSTVHTQDESLRALFQWQTHASELDNILSTLESFRFVDEEELSKFVPRVLDSLFSISASNRRGRQDEVDNLVFKALAKVLAMSSDRRFPSFVPLLDAYIASQFNFPASHVHLLKSMKAVMAEPQSKEYRSFLKIWHLFFRFVVRARELDRARDIGADATSKHLEDDFKRQTKAILGEINNLMSSSDKSLIGTQTLAVQHYADILPDLAQVFSPMEIAEMVVDFADTMTFSKGSIAIYKLLLLLQVIKSVFGDVEARTVLIPAILRWIKPYLGRYVVGYVGTQETQDTLDAKRVKWLECNRLAVTVVGQMVNKLQEYLSVPATLENDHARRQEEDNIEYAFALLPSLVESHAELGSEATAASLARQRSTSATLFRPTPDVFPTSHPFALLSELPPPSLLDKRVTAADPVPSAGNFICGLAESTAVIFSLVLAAPRPVLSRWLEELLDIEGPKTASKILQNIFAFCNAVIRNDAFPPSWLTLNLMCLGSTIRLLDPIADLLERHYIPQVSDAAEFDAELWRTLLELLIAFCDNDQLVLEDMSQQRRRAQWIIAGDLRDEGAGLLLKLWNSLGWEQNQGTGLKYGGYQTKFTGLAGKVLGLCLSTHDALSEAAVEILFSMIYAEHAISGNIGTIQVEIFAKLDDLFSKNASPSDPTAQAYFVTQLRTIFEASTSDDAVFRTRVGDLLDEIETFIDLLLTLRQIPDTPQWKDERSLALSKLLAFTHRTGRSDLYVRFLHQLVQTSLETNDHLAAGHALKRHADLYSWSIEGDLLDVFSGNGIELPPQNEFARRESLLYHVMDHFVEAEAYESALRICQEITAQHQRTTFAVPKMSELLIYQARLWEKIESTTRPVPEYFRVAYFGDVGIINRGKDYIVRGQPRETYPDFCEAIQIKHPTAMIHRSKAPPPESIRHGEEPVIWVTAVHPEPEAGLAVLADHVVENVQAYWRSNEINRFSSQRPYMRADSNDQTSLSWIEKTVLTTAEKLPSGLSRSEVVGIEYEQISPLSNALAEVERATKIVNAAATGHVDVKHLGNIINGAVDAPPTAGVKLYRDVFLDQAYLDSHPADIAQVNQLRASIREYVAAVAAALEVHREICRDEPFHETLRSHFHRAFDEEIAGLPRAISPTALNAPLPPIPRMLSAEDANQVVSPARLSTMSIGSTSAYILPNLRLGPSITPPAPSNGVIPFEEYRRPPSVPVTAISSPKSTFSGMVSRLSVDTPSFGRPGMGSRMHSGRDSMAASGLSVENASVGPRDSVSEMSEDTVGALPKMSNGLERENGVGGSGSVKRKGLKRLSGLFGA